jgi:hypothetical protein
MTVSRRVFLETLAATAGPLFVDVRSLVRGRTSPVLRIGLVAVEHPEMASMSRGAIMGVAEARRTASLLGGDLSLVQGTDPDHMLGREGVHVLLGGTDARSSDALSEAAAGAGRVFFNIGARADVLREAQCRRSTFHIAASDAMRGDAMAASATSRGQGSIESWHASLDRYGAAQLNDRYRAEHAQPMDSAAWNAWVAVKIAWEAVARLRAFETPRVIEWLEHPRTRFDGHKGRALSFRSWDHQLRQPLYRVVSGQGGAAITEIPPMVRGDTTAVADRLDLLGTRNGASACRWDTP